MNKLAIVAVLASFALVGCSQSDSEDAATGASATEAAAGDGASAAQPAAAQPEASAIAARADGAQLYLRCSACHQKDGSGVQGAFPALKEDFVKLAADAKGRQYLANVLRYGASGKLEGSYGTVSGMMPAQYPGLNEAEIAEVLNYVNQQAGGQGEPFTTQEVLSAISSSGVKSASEVIALRPKI